MNRAEVARAIAACEALAKELRGALSADAAAEYAEQGTAPTWRMPGLTVIAATSNDAVSVVDEAVFTAWVAQRYPTEVVTEPTVRPAFRAKLLAEAVKRGDPPCDDEGEIIPGLEYRPGGEFRSIAVKPSSTLRARLHTAAREIAEGRAPLVLPIGGSDGA